MTTIKLTTQLNGVWVETAEQEFSNVDECYNNSIESEQHHSNKH